MVKFQPQFFFAQKVSSFVKTFGQNVNFDENKNGAKLGTELGDISSEIIFLTRLVDFSLLVLVRSLST